MTAEAEFYEIDFSCTNPETHKNDTKSQQRAHRTEVQNERSFERELLFVLTATNKKNRPLNENFVKIFAQRVRVWEVRRGWQAQTPLAVTFRFHVPVVDWTA